MAQSIDHGYLDRVAATSDPEEVLLRARANTGSE
jgi:hypothetical protein